MGTAGTPKHQDPQKQACLVIGSLITVNYINDDDTLVRRDRAQRHSLKLSSERPPGKSVLLTRPSCLPRRRENKCKLCMQPVHAARVGLPPTPTFLPTRAPANPNTDRYATGPAPRHIKNEYRRFQASPMLAAVGKINMNGGEVGARTWLPERPHLTTRRVALAGGS